MAPRVSGREGQMWLSSVLVLGSYIKDSLSFFNRQSGGIHSALAIFHSSSLLLDPRFISRIMLLLLHLTILAASLLLPLRFRAHLSPCSFHLVSSFLDDFASFATCHSVAAAVFVTNLILAKKTNHLIPWLSTMRGHTSHIDSTVTSLCKIV